MLPNGISRRDLFIQDGWTERFIANEPRLSEAVEMYKESGYEVLLLPLPKDNECQTCLGDGEKEACWICFDGVEDQYKMIFTRPIKR